MQVSTLLTLKVVHDNNLIHNVPVQSRKHHVQSQTCLTL